MGLAFSAVGLISAGFINDFSRKYGAISCVAALVFPFASLILPSSVGYTALMWVLGYILFGFFAVYRVVMFADFADQNLLLLPLAGVGLLSGRIGDGLGALAGILLSGKTVALISATSGLFVVSILDKTGCSNRFGLMALFE